MPRFGYLALVAGAAIGLSQAPEAAPAVKSSAPITTPAGSCIVPAAQYHRVNAYVLWVILKVESNLNAKAIGTNSNGTIDVGIGQINSIHFKTLRAYGIHPEQLLDACVGTYVAAWHLSKLISVHGNSWESVARYHSASPYLNYRYRVLLNNELVRAGVLRGAIYPVPPLLRGPGPAMTPDQRRSSSSTRLAPSVITDAP